MNKADAQMWAEVARVLGAHSATAQETRFGPGVYMCVVTWTKDGGFHEFDPPNNPADERRLWKYLERYPTQGLSACRDFLLYGHSRVTSLGEAIAALPESEV